MWRLVWSESAAGDQAVEVGMIHEVLTPGVQQRSDPQADAEALGSKLQKRG